MTEKEKIYLRFVSCILNGKLGEADFLKTMDWQGLYDFAKRHAVLGVVYYGISHLEEGQPRPLPDLELKFYGSADRIRRNNIKLNMVAGKLTDNMKKAGFPSCILKGQGNALMYPDPMIRQSGDIDIWLDGSRGDIFKMVKRDVGKASNQYHHIDYPMVKGVSIEIHYIPSFMNHPLLNHRMQKYYNSVRNEQFCNMVELPDDSGTISRPTDELNRVFQLSHVFKHFIIGGVGLRQMIDYYYLLRRGITEEEKKACQKTLKSLHLLKFARAMMYVMQEALGLENQYLIVEPDYRLGKKLLSEVITAGNFGRSDTRFKYKGKNKGMKRLFYTFRPWRYALEFPEETLMRPLFLGWHQVWKKWQALKYDR